MLRVLLASALGLSTLRPLLAQVRTGDTAYARFVVRSSVPSELWERFKAAGLFPEYDINVDHLNPFYLTGDFDGDGRYDFAVKLRNRRGGPDRLAVIRGSGPVAWLDRDEQLRYPTLTAWYVHPKYKPVGQGVGEGSPPVLRGDAIMIILVEASSSLIYWNGTRFVSYWQGD